MNLQKSAQTLTCIQNFI